MVEETGNFAPFLIFPEGTTSNSTLLFQFKKGASFSMHYHIKKEETWCVTRGALKLEYFDLEKAERKERELREGDVVHLKPCVPHKLTAMEESSVFEVSTEHFNEDSYRVEKGSSQK